MTSALLQDQYKFLTDESLFQPTKFILKVIYEFLFLKYTIFYVCDYFSCMQICVPYVCHVPRDASGCGASDPIEVVL